MAKYTSEQFPYQAPVATPGQPLTPEMWDDMAADRRPRLVRVYKSSNSASVAAYRLRRDPQNLDRRRPLQFHPVVLVEGDVPFPPGLRGTHGVVTGPGRFPTALDDDSVAPETDPETSPETSPEAE